MWKKLKIFTRNLYWKVVVYIRCRTVWRKEWKAYEDIFTYTPDGIMPGRLVVDRYTQLLYATGQSDIDAIKKHMDSGLSKKEAVLKLIEEEKGKPS